VGKFIVRNGDLEGRKFRLEPGAKITLGRERADINFFDKRMSRRHCTLEVHEGSDCVVDLGSTNGTWVNNQRIKEADLQPGDLVRVGFTELEFLGNPEPSMPSLPVGPAVGDLNPSQTIAFRAKDLKKPPTPERRRRFHGKDRLAAARSAAMGKPTGERQYISAKGKFCEACGEAIFVREGAPDEGKVVDGLYLCRMCALISEKQKELGKDGLMPSFARIVGGRMSGSSPSDVPPDSGARMEIEEEEVSLEDLTGPDEGESAAEPPAGDPAAGAAEVPAEVPAEAPAVALGEAPVEPPPEAAAPEAQTKTSPAALPAVSDAESVAAEEVPPVEDAPPAGPSPPVEAATSDEVLSLDDLPPPDEDVGMATKRDDPSGPAPAAGPAEADLGSAEALAFLDQMLESSEDGDAPAPAAGETGSESGDGPGADAESDSVTLPDDIRLEAESGESESDGDSEEGDGTA
jgi:hypothetical protein